MKMANSTFHLAGPETRTGFTSAIAGWFARREADVRAYLEYRRDLAVLREMDDRMLQDAGLTRYDVRMSYRAWR